MTPRALTLAAVLLVGSCSGGGDRGSERVTDTTGDPAANKARAERLTFQPSDFPAGWTRTGGQDTQGERQDKEFRDCLGLGEDVPEASSTFGKGDALAASEINVAASSEAAADDLALFAGDKAPECVKQALVRVFSNLAPPEIIKVSVTRLKLPGYGQSSAAYRAVARVGTESDTVAIYADLVGIRQGPVQASLSFSNLGAALPEKLEKSLLTKLAGRMTS